MCTAASLLVSGVAACGSDDGDAESTATDAPAATEASPAATEASPAVTEASPAATEASPPADGAFAAFLSGPVAARLVGGSAPLLIPAALVGALLVLVADLCGQYAFSLRYPVGVVTGVLGAPYLVYLIVRTNRGGAALSPRRVGSRSSTSTSATATGR